MQQSFPTTILYGADYNPEQWPEGIWLDDMRLMKLASVNMASINIFSWASLEPQPGDYHFEQLDRIMDMLAQHGIAADLATATASPPTSWRRRAVTRFAETVGPSCASGSLRSRYAERVVSADRVRSIHRANPSIVHG